MAGNIPLSGLARRLVQEGLLSEDAAGQAVQDASQERIPLVGYLVGRKLVKARDVAMVAAEDFGDPVLDLDAFDPESLPKGLIKEDLIRKHGALPLFKRGNRLFVALSDPTRLQALDDFKFASGMHAETILVEEDKLSRLIEKHLESQSASSMQNLDEDLDNLDITGGEPEPGDDSGVGSGEDDAPIVRFINGMLMKAIQMGSSDLHFEPYEKAYRIRFRTDGILHEVARPPVTQGVRMAARLKVMSQLDISERRVPQDGRIKLKVSKTRAIDFRVNTCPTLFGEKIVLRILDPSSAKLGIDALGYEPAQKALFMAALEKPQGMFLVTGPTGSGKTVSLYTGLHILNTAENNISTAEDPVEINLEGINQVNVNPKVGLGFSAALKAFLRQDPDIIMVGEIRDLETAEIGIKAAQTGHMVMSTLHTNSAAETITRMLNMGVPSFNLATTINLIVAQRLARRLCGICKKPREIPRHALQEEGFTEAQIDAGFTIYGPVGCDQCKDGYKGRTGIYEVVRITPALARMIMEGRNSIDLAEQMRIEGFPSLRESGLKKALDGLTSLEEINRVTSSD